MSGRVLIWPGRLRIFAGRVKNKAELTCLMESGTFWHTGLAYRTHPALASESCHCRFSGLGLYSLFRSQVFWPDRSVGSNWRMRPVLQLHLEQSWQILVEISGYFFCFLSPYFQTSAHQTCQIHNPEWWLCFSLASSSNPADSFCRTSFLMVYFWPG